MRRNLGFALVVLLVAAATVLVVAYLGRDPREAPGTHPAPAAGGAQAEPGATSVQEGPAAEKSTSDAGADTSDGGQATSSRFLPTFSADAATHECAKHLMGVYSEYEPRAVIVTFSEGTTPEAANALLAQAKAVAPAEVTQADLDYGLVTLSVADGLVVEDAVVELADAPEVDVVQPNYVYRINDESRAGATSLVSRLAQANPAHRFARPAATTSPAGELLRAAADEQEVAIDDFDGYSSSQRAARTWHLTDVNAFKAWWYLRDQNGLINNDARIAVFDNGFDVTNQDILPGYDSDFAYNTADRNNDISEMKGDGRGHGTHVAGIAAARANNGVLTAGVSYNAPLALLKVFSSKGYANSSALWAAYDRVEEFNRQGANIRVVNMSLGASLQYVDESGETATIKGINQLENMDGYDTVLYDCAKDAFDSGIVTVCAAGNSSVCLMTEDDDGNLLFDIETPPYANYPSDMSCAVGVINLDKQANRSFSSNMTVLYDEDLVAALPSALPAPWDSWSWKVVQYGSYQYVDITGDFGSNFNYPGTRTKNISAPGTSIYSTYGTGTASLSGTSMASPVVAGVFSMIFAEKSELSASEARAIAYCCAKDLQYSDSRGTAGEGWDEQTGYGEIDALAIMRNLNPEIIGPGEMLPGETGTCTLSCGNPDADVTWTSDDASIVSVTSDGTVRAGARGATTIRATFTERNDEGDSYTGSASFDIATNSIARSNVTVENQTFTGEALEPTPIVRMGSDVLVPGVDYIVSYENNVNAGEGVVKLAGIGAWTGTSSCVFQIEPAPIRADMIEVADQYYTGSWIKPEPTVVFAGVALRSGTDFKCAYDSQTNVELGTSRLTVTGLGNFTGTAEKSFNITPRPLAEGVEVTVPVQTYDFGSELKPAPNVHFNGRALTRDRNYSVVGYENNTAAGTATVIVEGAGNFTGVMNVSFEIVPKSLSGAQVAAAAQTYTGNALTPVPTVRLGERQLAQGSDYTIASYNGNVGVGTGRVIVKGTGNFQGEATGTFSIGPRDLSGASVTAADQTYTGGALSPGVAVTLGGRRLASGIDYTVSYASNVGPGTATVTVWGRGNYTGSARGSFHIADGGVLMYRLYNPYSGEHFYTASEAERNSLDSIGWNYEGVGWKAPTTGDPVYRLYNPYTGDHHYTLGRGERDALVAVGWNYEGKGWNSGGKVALWRQYNPYASVGSHNYTTSTGERDALMRAGWRDEGVGWYGIG